MAVDLPESLTALHDCGCVYTHGEEPGSIEMDLCESHGMLMLEAGVTAALYGLESGKAWLEMRLEGSYGKR